MTEKTDIVSRFVENHAVADRQLAKAARAAERMVADAQEGLALGMVGGTNAKAFVARHRQVVGLIGEAAALLADLHEKGTAIAKANGADLGRITHAAGIELPEPEFSVKSGGR